MMEEMPQFLKDMYVEAIKERLADASRQLFHTVAGPPPTEAQLAQWQLEQEERERKEQEALNKRFLGTVTAVSEDAAGNIYLTYDDGRSETIYTGGWDEDY